MGVDASIALGVKPVQIENPMNALAQVMQLKNAQQSNALNALQMEKHRAEMADENQLRDLTRQSGGDMNKLRELAYGAGNYKQGMVLDKTLAERKKSEFEMQNQGLDMAKKRLDMTGQAFGALRSNPTPENASAILDYLGQQDILQPEQIQQFRQQITANPGGIGALADQVFRWSLSATAQLPKTQTNNIGGSTITQAIDPVTGKPTMTGSIQNTQSPDSVVSQATTRRGQDLVNARARDATAATMSKPFEVTGEDGKPVLVRQDKQGNIRPVQGYLPKQGAGKPLNETQGKANLFGTRMKESHRILSELEDQGVLNSGLIKGAVQGTVGLTPFMGDKLSDAAGSVMNVLPGALGGPNSGQQRVEQARRDFVNAVLRRESGAVISPQEFANAERQYFPQPGDSKEVLQQKRRNRELAIQGLEVEVPGGFRSPGANNGKAAPNQAASGKVVEFWSLK